MIASRFAPGTVRREAMAMAFILLASCAPAMAQVERNP
jgi:hypothetical protein